LPRLAEAAVLQDPQHLAGGPQLVELGIGEVARLDGQDLGGAAVPFAFRSMALKARPLAEKDGLALGQDLRRRLEGRLEGLGGGSLADRDARQGDAELAAGLAVARRAHVRSGEAMSKQQCE